ncbi:hypothetical protein B0H13DRAFT_2325629 [Mycena leptocephala]|nr:hypothetical protein B0H13DRAFT_2325629 [Mycena leptocephala]
MAGLPDWDVHGDAIKLLPPLPVPTKLTLFVSALEDVPWQVYIVLKPGDSPTERGYGTQTWYPGLLAISTVDLGAKTSRSTAQIASYISAVASLGGIIVGLILARQNRNRCDANIDEAADYLAQHSDSPFGFQPLASLYSVPFALLMWAYNQLQSIEFRRALNAVSAFKREALAQERGDGTSNCTRPQPHAT